MKSYCSGARMGAHERRAILVDIAERLAHQYIGHPVRVAVDGRTASGKTTFADELAAVLTDLGRNVIRISIDGFHRPRTERYARGRHSAEGYYYDARDLPAIVELLLSPLGPSGDRRYRTASFDLEADKAIRQDATTAVSDAILIVDGTFLQRPELRDHWDVVIFARASEEIAEERGIERDEERLGATEARRLYATRYRLAYDLYERLCEPEHRSDAIVDNDDPQAPRLLIRPRGRLG